VLLATTFGRHSEDTSLDQFCSLSTCGALFVGICSVHSVYGPRNVFCIVDVLCVEHPCT
jgi:hypothetical protein